MKDFLKGVIYVGIFTIPFIPLIVTDSMFFPFITGKNFTFRIAVEVIFAAWVLLALLDRAYRPRFSWIMAGFSAFLLVMFVANLLSEYPLKSFWSNFERMDGYVTLVHVFLLFAVAGSFIRDRIVWQGLFWISVSVAGIAALLGLQQYFDSSNSVVRVDGRLGNAAYMAVYMFFSAFLAVWLIIHHRQMWVRALLVFLFSLFIYVLILTATRGTFLGIVAGLGVTMLYLIAFSKAYPVVRKSAAGILIGLTLLVSTIYVFKDTEFVSSNLALSRFANISMSDLDVRFDIWSMAWLGVQERPILGWGQGSFNYVFNKYYHPDLYRAETWYDRAHNIALDWLVAGGVVGFVSYVSIFIALLYYLVWRPLRTHDEENNDEYFTVTERAVLIGLFAGYIIHNLVVFDNIVSYIFFAFIIALIHARVGEVMTAVDDFELDPRIVTNIAAPVMLVVAGTCVYFINFPPMFAALDIIDALQASTVDGRMKEMDSALARDSFAFQEIVEQYAQQSMQINANQNIPRELRQAFASRAEVELLELAKRKPGDARVHVFISGYYRNIGNMGKAKEHIDIARQLSPTKQAIIMEQGILSYQVGDYEAMYEYFKHAFELQPDYKLARTFYAAALLYVGRADEFDAVIATGDQFLFFARNDFALEAARRFEQNEILKRIFEARIKLTPANAQFRSSLAFLYYQDGDVEKSVEVLETAANEIPSFTQVATCYAENMKAGKKPDEGC